MKYDTVCPVATKEIGDVCTKAICPAESQDRVQLQKALVLI